MQQDVDFLEKIRLLECARHIRTTSAVTSSRFFVVRNDIGEKRFSPSWIFRVLAFVPPFLFLRVLVTDKYFGEDWIGHLPGLTAIACMLAYVLYRFYFGKKYNYTIVVSAEGIQMGEVLHPWSTIYATAILERRENKRKRKYFVIAMSDMYSYEVYHMSNFFSLHMLDATTELAQYIEYFRPRQKIS